MLTPRFCIDQDSVTVIVSITVPHVRVVGNMEVYVDGKIFSFYCKPYLLKLVFPHEIISPEDEIDVDGFQMEDKSQEIMKERSKEMIQSHQIEEKNPLKESKIQPISDLTAPTKMDLNDKHSSDMHIEAKDSHAVISAKNTLQDRNIDTENGKIKIVEFTNKSNNVEHRPDEKKKESIYKVVYDPDKDNGTVTIHLEKAIHGQVFENLDLTTMLLQPKQVDQIPSIYDHVQRKNLEELGSSLSKINEDSSNEKKSHGTKTGHGPPLIEVISSSSNDGKEEDQMEEEISSVVLSKKVVKEPIEDLNTHESEEREEYQDEESEASEDSDEEGENKIMSVRAFNILNNEASSTKGISLSNDSIGSSFPHRPLSSNSERQKSVSMESSNTEFNITIRATNYYGFNNQYCNVFKGLREDLVGVIRLDDPDISPSYMRSLSRIDDENKDFDVERYLGDFVGEEEDPLYEEAFQYVPFWDNHRSNNSDDQTFELTLEDRMHLMSIKNKEYLIDRNKLLKVNENKLRPIPILLTLTDILLSYAYEHRTTSGEPTVESCWTLVSLSPAFSYLENYIHDSMSHSSTAAHFSNVEDVTLVNYKNAIRTIALTFIRRCLIYPYLRSYTLAANAVKDASRICKLGKRAILHSLLGIKNIFERTENYYYFNKILVDDYLCYVQKYDDMDEALLEIGQTLEECLGIFDDKQISSVETLEQFRINKEDITFNGDTILELEELVKENNEEMQEDDTLDSSSMDSDSDSDSDSNSDCSSDESRIDNQNRREMSSSATKAPKVLIEEI